LYAKGGAFDGRQHPFHHVDEHFFGSTDDQRPEGGATDGHQLRHVNQRANVATRHGETTKDGPDYDNTTNDDNHDFPWLVP
jgi:hypothetical protein